MAWVRRSYAKVRGDAQYWDLTTTDSDPYLSVNEILPIQADRMLSLINDLTRDRDIDITSYFLGLLAFFIPYCVAPHTVEMDSYHILKRTFLSLNIFLQHHRTAPEHQERVLNGLYHSRLIPLLAELVEMPSCNLRSFSPPERNPLHALAHTLRNVRANCPLTDHARGIYCEMVSGLEAICTRPSPLVDSHLCERVRHLALPSYTGAPSRTHCI